MEDKIIKYVNGYDKSNSLENCKSMQKIFLLQMSGVWTFLW